jgi:hypothetical protein
MKRSREKPNKKKKGIQASAVKVVKGEDERREKEREPLWGGFLYENADFN